MSSHISMNCFSTAWEMMPLWPFESKMLRAAEYCRFLALFEKHPLFISFSHSVTVALQEKKHTFLIHITILYKIITSTAFSSLLILILSAYVISLKNVSAICFHKNRKPFSQHIIICFIMSCDTGSFLWCISYLLVVLFICSPGKCLN